MKKEVKKLVILSDLEASKIQAVLQYTIKFLLKDEEQEAKAFYKELSKKFN